MCRSRIRPARHRIELPERLAAGGVERLDEPAGSELATGNPDQHLIFHDERRAGDAGAFQRI
jgi:hypothetical protein